MGWLQRRRARRQRSVSPTVTTRTVETQRVYADSYDPVYPLSNVGSVAIGTDGELAVGIGNGLAIESDGDLAMQVGGVAIPLGGDSTPAYDPPAPSPEPAPAYDPPAPSPEPSYSPDPSPSPSYDSGSSSSYDSGSSSYDSGSSGGDFSGGGGDGGGSW